MKASQFISSAMLTVVMSSYAFAQAAPPASPDNALPDGAGKPIVVRACVGCHSLKVVVSRKATREDWSKVVNEMVTRGADLSDDEIDKVIDYLSTNFKPDDAKTEQSTAQQR
jgi:mono/diheme cytochrome c family protein